MIPLRSNLPRPGYQGKYLHLPKRPRRSWIFDFRRSVPRKFARVWCHLEWFLKLYNLSLRFKAIHRLNSGLKPTQTPTQKFKKRFLIIISLVWYHFKWFFRLYNLRFSASRSIYWVQNPENPGIQPSDKPLFHYLDRKNVIISNNQRFMRVLRLKAKVIWWRSSLVGNLVVS